MGLGDESWKNSYDDWKLASPYDDEPEDECWHEDSEIDILTGRATCWRCGESWYASDAELQAQEEHERRYGELCAEQERPWYRFKNFLAAFLSAWRLPVLWRKRRPIEDDEIPF